MKLLKIGDVIAILSVLILAASSAFLSYGQMGALVCIHSNSKLYGEYSLAEDRKIFVESEYGWNEIVISDGRVWVHDASCKDKLDVSQGKIYKSGQSIICLPNRLIVTIKGGAQTDALSY